MCTGIFRAVFNLGGIVGSGVAFGSNFKSQRSWQRHILNPDNMIRTDRNQVRHPSWKTEFFSLFVALKTDPWVILLFPMFYASNYFYTWQFNDYNGALFTIRARGLNNFMYWTSQIFGSIFIGYFILDQKRVRRRVRAFAGWVVVFLMVFIVHVWAYFYQKTYTRAEETAPGAYKIDIMDKNYPAHIWLMIFYGFLDSMWQTYAYWLMGAMSNDPAKLGVFTGFYKSLQSAGAAGVWRADAVGIPYMNIFLSTWGLTVAGMIFAAPMVYLRVKDHTDLEDETLMRIEGVEKIEPPVAALSEKA